MSDINNIIFKEIERVSPSQFYSMKNCAYKSVLAEAFDKKPLLPVSPNAYLGILLHKVLELISKGKIKDEEELDKVFDAEILLIEKNLHKNSQDIFVPLQMNIRDFGMKRIQLKKHLRRENEVSMQYDGYKFISEKWFESKDKLVGGKIDLIIENREEVEIIDFKTSRITEDLFDDEGYPSREVKNEYQTQLKLYAYLYYDSTGIFPTKLSIVDLAKQKFNVDFSKDECKKYFEEAKVLLVETNKCIETKVFKSNPSEINCKFCLYRPACSFYLQHQTTDNSFNDVCGSIANVIQYHNGNVSVFIKKGGQNISIIGFDADKYEYFNKKQNMQINLFNLRKGATNLVYSVTKMTKIYE